MVRCLLDYAPDFELSDQGETTDTLSIQESGQFKVCTLTDNSFDCVKYQVALKVALISSQVASCELSTLEICNLHEQQFWWKQ